MDQHAQYERARLARDARFDGRFFVGVRTTGIYCRPICPAVSPRSENVKFYDSAAAAAEAGYRPCLRCRPECAPGTPAWNGTSTTVRRGMRLISAGALEHGSIEELAERLGVTSRHLRRLFSKHLGASPQAIAHTQRLHFAKRLIDESDLPMSHVASASGYRSVRRFNDAFRKTYGRAPRELRRRNKLAPDSGASLTVRLPFTEPYDWSALLSFFAARATPGVEQIEGDAYYRTVRVNDEPGIVECRRDDKAAMVRLTLHGVAVPAVYGVVQRFRDILDLDAPVDDIGGLLCSDSLLAPSVRDLPGVRVPGSWDGFELTVRAILGQQVSVKAATTMAGRVADRYGESIPLPGSLDQKSLTVNRLFPTPEKLVRARFNNMGLIGSRAATIRRVAAAVIAGQVQFDGSQPPAELRAALTGIAGIGDWTAQYVAMRTVKDPDAFPVTDLALLKAAAREGCDKPRALTERAESWRPWRAYAAMLLWSSVAGSGG